MAMDLLVDAVVYGNLLSLLSIGLSLTLLTTRVSNFAHGDFATVGIYVAYTMSVLFGANPYLFLPFSFVGGLLLGFLVYRVVFEPLRGKASLVTLMIVSMALDFILRYSVQIYADVLQRSLGVYTRGIVFKDVNVNFLGSTLPGLLVISSAVAWLFLLLLYLFLYKTKVGIAMRAVIENPSLSEALGINVKRVYALSWMLSASFASVAGVFLPFRITVNPDTGFSILLSIFAAVTLGGLESLLGSIIGAYIIAFSETVGVYYLSQIGLSTAYRPAISFITLALVLLLYPRGLAGLWSKR